MVIAVIISFVIGCWCGLAFLAMFVAGAREDKNMEKRCFECQK